MERRDFKTDYSIVIISSFYSYYCYYDTWEDAQQSFIRLTEYLKGNDYTLIREIILTFKNSIKAICILK